jgi:hypothetical protein
VRMRNWDCKDTGREERMGWFLFFFTQGEFDF